MPASANLVELLEDGESPQAMVRALLVERDAETQRAVEQQRRAEDLHIENPRSQVELARYKKWHYGPRADRLRTAGELAQLLLSFARLARSQAGPPG